MNISGKVKKQLPGDIRVFLRMFGEAAAAHSLKLFLVGGIVRDMMIGISNSDLDLVVEGDAIALAESIKLDNIKITTHPDFGTANIKWNRWSIDIASARSEKYVKPGSLPEISFSNINIDLMRRDFSINAMAMSLVPENYGELIDPYNGYADIKNKYIRVLHENSFIDDATRIWRAIRYEQRLDFSIEPVTLCLLKRDVKLLHTISGDRIRHEIELVFKERKPEKVLYRADELQALTNIHPSLRVDEWLIERLEEARETGLTESSLSNVYQALLFYRLDSTDLEKLMSWLHFNRKTGRVLKETLQLKNELIELKKNRMKSSDIYFLLYGYSDLAIIVNSLATESMVIEKNIDLYLSRLQRIKARLNGDDLKKMGITEGPQIKSMLHMLHTARLDGIVSTRQGEVRLVYNWLEKEHEGKMKKGKNMRNLHSSDNRNQQNIIIDTDCDVAAIKKKNDI